MNPNLSSLTLEQLLQYDAELAEREAELQELA